MKMKMKLGRTKEYRNNPEEMDERREKKRMSRQKEEAFLSGESKKFDDL